VHLRLPGLLCTAAESSTSQIVINVLAEAATVAGTSDKPGYLPGYGALPAERVTELAKQAKLRPVAIPKDLLAEPQYRPSVATARFIRCRDLTCRWPGCDQPAAVSDIDHTVPYPVGPTHASNNKLYCRIHRRLAGIRFTHGNNEKPAPRGDLHTHLPRQVRRTARRPTAA
jgi:hypothetical protein